MITNNLSTLKIHRLSQEQYNREKEAGNLDETALYLTPDNGGGGLNLDDLNNLPNLYTWKKYTANPREFSLNPTNSSFGLVVNGFAQVDYTKNLEVSDGNFVGDFELVSSSDVAAFDVIKGNYVRTLVLDSSTSTSYYIYYYIPSDVTLTKTDNGLTSSQTFTLSINTNVGTFVEFVASETQDTYPNSGLQDGYWYEYYKQLGSSGIYIGSGEMPDGYNIQIDPTGEYDEPAEDTTTALSGKTLIGDITLNSSNLTATGTTGIYTLGTDVQTVMTSVFAKLDEGFDTLIAELVMNDLILTYPCIYGTGSESMNYVQGIFVTSHNFGHDSESIVLYDFLENVLRTNQSTSINALLSNGMSFNVKFYAVYGNTGSGTTVAEEELPAVSYTDNGKVLMVVNGQWAVSPINNSSNSTLPSAEEASF